MTVVKPYSVDPSGRWSRPQAYAVVTILNREARERGQRIHFMPIEITVVGDQTSWYIVQAYCSDHNEVMELDGICRMCASRAKANRWRWWQ